MSGYDTMPRSVRALMKDYESKANLLPLEKRRALQRALDLTRLLDSSDDEQ